jgi:integrase
MARRSPLGIKGTSVWYQYDAAGKAVVAVVRAKDQAGKYEAQSFPVTSWKRDKEQTPVLPAGATEWAESKRENFIRGEEVAGSADFQETAKVLVANLEAAGIEKGRRTLIDNVSKALAADGIRDMKSDMFAARIRSWITDLKSGWSLPEGAKNARTNPTPLQPATRNKLLVICRQVTGLAVKKRRLPYDPLAELPRFKEAEHFKPLFTIKELRWMVSDEALHHTATARADLEAEIDRLGGARTDAVKAIAAKRGCHWTTLYNIMHRDPKPDPWWLACCLLVYTGCRADEAMHLRWEWIKWDQHIITLKLAEDYDSKTDTERMIPLEPELQAILDPIMKTHGHILAPEIRAGGSGMKLTEKGKEGVGARDYTNALRLYLRRIGIDPTDRTAHSLRHCYISLKMARADMNTDRLRKAVGHADFKTTAGYGKLSQLFEAEVDRWPDATLWLRRPVPGVAATVGKVVGN